MGYLLNSMLLFLIPGDGSAARSLLLAPALVAETWFCALLLRRSGGLHEWAEPEHAAVRA